MNKHLLLSASLGLLFLGGDQEAAFASNNQSAPPIDSVRGSKPNIIFILADDMGYNDVSFNGQKNFSTPALDRMASEGIILTNHYAGSTVCGPSRATLLTGNHTGRVYQRGNGPIEFREDPLDITIATRLQQAGYHTAMIGKSGVAVNSDNAELPNIKGFDHFFGFLSHVAAHRYYPKVLYRNGKAVHYPKNEGQTGEVYSGDVILDDALRYLDQQGPTDKPFFLHFAIQQPHADLAVPDEFLAPFIGKFEENPTAYQSYVRTPYPAATYAAMINYVDHTVRRVLQKLRELGIDDKTVVIFSTDNGSHEVGGYHYSVHNSNAPFRGGKRDLYDGGIRVPTVAWWPGKIPAGTRSEHVSAFWDFAPTALELAGLEVPISMDGISYLPTLLGQDDQQQAHEYLYWEFYERGGRQAVRYGQWKGIRLNVMQDRYGPIELYNIVEDPSETNNLANQYPEIVARIAAFMVEAHETPEFEGFSFD
jgi:arylsulfatase A